MYDDITDKIIFEELIYDHDERVSWLNHELKIQPLKFTLKIRKSVDEVTKYFDEEFQYF